MKIVERELGADKDCSNLAGQASSHHQSSKRGRCRAYMDNAVRKGMRVTVRHGHHGQGRQHVQIGARRQER